MPFHTPKKRAAAAKAGKKAASAPTKDVAAAGGMHGRGTMSASKGKAPASVKQTRRTK